MLTTRLPLAAALTAVASTALATTLLAVPVQAERPSHHATSHPADPPWVSIAEGLDNPRHLSFSGHTLYVAEAGRGGSGPCAVGAEGEVCFGESGAITRITRWGTRRVVTGLPSLAAPDGSGAIGPTDVVVRGHDWYAATIGLGNDPAVRDTFGAPGRSLGTVVTGSLRGGAARVFGDLAAHEASLDPDGNGADSNPTGMIRSGGSFVVTDAGGNTLVRARPGGRVKTLAVFANTLVPAPPFLPPGMIPMQAVPTSVARGDDGAYYVSQLTGFPFPTGGSSIWRVMPGQTPTVYATGLTNVTDLAWYRGSLYAVQLSDVGLLNEADLPMGSLVRVSGGGTATTVVAGLPAPYGVALRRGTAFVTTCAVCPGGGSVVAIDLP